MYRRLIRLVFLCVVAVFLSAAWLHVHSLSVCASDGLEGLHDAAAEVVLPEGAESAFSDIGISAEDPTAVLELSPSEWIGMLWDTAKREIAAPIALLSALLTLILLSSTLAGMQDTVASGEMRKLLDMLCVLVCVGASAEPFCTCLRRTADALTEGSVFMGSFVPVFGGFLAAGGAVASGTSYQMLVLFLTQAMQQLTRHLLFPLLECAAALGIADAVNPSLRLNGMVGGLRKAVTWILGFLMTAFASLLSIRSFVADAADGLAVKTVRLMTSSLIPVVGGAVSEAYGSVQGSIRLMQSGTGVIGILGIVWLTVPPLISAVCYRAVFSLAGIAAELTGTDAVRGLCRDIEGVLGAAFAMLVTYAVMLIFSTAIMLMLVGNE